MGLNQSITTQSNVITVNNKKDFIKALRRRTPSQTVIFDDDDTEYFELNNLIISLLDVRFPRNLIELSLRNNAITSLLNVQFPPHLQDLDLSHNIIISLLNVQFPPNLQNLFLENNQITTLVI